MTREPTPLHMENQILIHVLRIVPFSSSSWTPRSERESSIIDIQIRKKRFPSVAGKWWNSERERIFFFKLFKRINIISFTAFVKDVKHQFSIISVSLITINDLLTVKVNCCCINNNNNIITRYDMNDGYIVHDMILSAEIYMNV